MTTACSVSATTMTLEKNAIASAAIARIVSLWFCHTSDMASASFRGGVDGYRRRRLLRSPAHLRQRQVGRHAPRFDDRLVRLAQHGFHRFVIEPAAGDFGSQPVLLVDLV